MKWRYVVIGILAFIVIAVVMTPASALATLTDDIADVDLSQWRGTLWSGQAQLAVRGQRAGALEWTLNPTQLVFGAIAADWRLTDVYHQFAGTAAAGFSETRVTADGHVDAPSTNRLLAPYQINIDGRVSVDGFAAVTDANGRLTGAAGTIEWDGGETRYQLGGRAYASQLPPLVGRITTEAASPSLTVSTADDDTPLMLATLKPDGWANIGITKQFTKMVGQPWRGREPDHAVVLEVEEKLF